jgi:hypothetical protein
MKILRSVTQRGFSVGTAGWFTVLRPNTWFPATRLHTGPHPLVGRSTGAAESTVPGQLSGSRSSTVAPPRIAPLNGNDRQPMRLAVAVLAGAAITSFLLWWMMGFSTSGTLDHW